MENAVDAIKMAFGMMVFVIAMTAAMYLFTIASSTSQVLLYAADKTNYYDNIEINKDATGTYLDVTTRQVNVETIIPTLYRYYKENFAVKIIDRNGNLTQIFDVNIEGRVRKAAGPAIDYTNPALTPDEQERKKKEWYEQQALISLYGIPSGSYFDAMPDSDKEISPYLFEAPWIGNTNKDFKTRIDLYINGKSRIY